MDQLRLFDDLAQSSESPADIKALAATLKSERGLQVDPNMWEP